MVEDVADMDQIIPQERCAVYVPVLEVVNTISQELISERDVDDQIVLEAFHKEQVMGGGNP